MKKLLGRLKAAGLALNPSKCLFLCREVGYLGHVISEKGVQENRSGKKFPKTKNKEKYRTIFAINWVISQNLFLTLQK